nr:immunoglobulin light chain junction region [Macaca mulatta]
CQQCNTLPYSF